VPRGKASFFTRLDEVATSNALRSTCTKVDTIRLWTTFCSQREANCMPGSTPIIPGNTTHGVHAVLKYYSPPDLQMSIPHHMASKADQNAGTHVLTLAESCSSDMSALQHGQGMTALRSRMARAGAGAALSCPRAFALASARAKACASASALVFACSRYSHFLREGCHVAFICNIKFEGQVGQSFRPRLQCCTPYALL
jgi:hypothetical protein